METGYDPNFWQNLQALQAAAAAKFGSGAIGISSGFRSPETQAQIIANNWHKFNLNPADKDRWLADVQQYGPEEAGNRWESVFNNATRVVEDGRGSPFRNWIALPARSHHQKGLAADLAYASPDVLSWAHQNAPEYNLAFPLSNENWHIELAGARSGQRSPQQSSQGSTQTRVATNQALGLRGLTKDATMTPMTTEAPQQRQGLLAGLLGGQGLGERLGMSQDFADKLAMAVMAGTGDARMQPLIAQRAAGMKERKAEAKDEAKRNKTAAYLRSIGMDGAAGLIETGLFTGAQALDISKSQEDRDLAEQAAAALMAGDNVTAMALLTRLSPTAMGQQLAARTANPQAEVIGGGKYTVTYTNGVPTISVNEDVIAAEQQIAQQQKIAQGLPSDARKAEEEDFAAMDTLRNLIQDTAGIVDLFGYNPKTNSFEGKLGIGPLDYLGGKLGSMGVGGAGMEDLAKARGEFERFKTRFINNSLRLNKGVQTEGDAQRVANELETASTEATAYAAIQELMKINERAYADRANAINRRRARFGLPAIETPAAPTSPNLQWSIVKP